ncbi:hypothetical protein I4U23_007459 [Adineta vaga]|nr:hypothetical protein I4U23_007459 [Adineta vaga]
MFAISLNEDKTKIQVNTNDEQNSISIAEGDIAVDIPHRNVMIIFNHITIPFDDYQQIDQFLSAVHSYINNLYDSLICIRFPEIFDNQIPFDKLQYHNNIADFMIVTMNHLKYYPENNLQDRQDQYELVTDRERIFNYAKQLHILMMRVAFWSKTWDFQEMCDRINSATNNAVILDKINNSPCAFGRLFLIKSKDETFGYISDIAVDSTHQSKGLGKCMVNYFVGIVSNSTIPLLNFRCTLCLQCAKEGSGSISAKKLYQRSGFQFLNDLDNRVAIFPIKRIATKHQNVS